MATTMATTTTTTKTMTITTTRTSLKVEPHVPFPREGHLVVHTPVSLLLRIAKHMVKLAAPTIKNNNEEDAANEYNNNDNDNHILRRGFRLQRRGDIARDAFIVRHFDRESEDILPDGQDDEDEMSVHSSDAWSQRGWDTESDSFHSSDAWSRREDEHAYESDSELDREFDAIDWRPETPPSIGALYSSMHEDLYSRPFRGNAPVSCASGTLPTMSVGDLTRSFLAHMNPRTCKAFDELNKPNENCSEGARNLFFKNVDLNTDVLNSSNPAGSLK
jgi:hypothetical protein